MEKKKLQVLIKPKCEKNVRNKWIQKFGEQCELVFEDHEAGNLMKSAEVVIGEPDEEEIQKAEKLRWIQLTWAGADKYTNMQTFPEKVMLTNASGAFGKIISEYVIGNIISMYRAFPGYWKDKQKHIWNQRNSSETICGKKVLILGTGDIGRNIAHRMKAFEAQVTGIKRTATGKKPEDFDRIFSLKELDQQLPEADIVIGCLPGTGETKGLLDYRRLCSMKKGAVLVNVGRGSLICQDALTAVLRKGYLKGAILDVFEKEPLSETSPLWEMENVILTPHIAGPSFGGNRNVEEQIWEICMENMERYLTGQKLKNLVHLKEGY